MGWFDDQKKKAADAVAEGAKDAATKAGQKAVSGAWAAFGRLVRGAAQGIAKATDEALSAAEAHIEEREKEQATEREQADVRAEAQRTEAEARRQAILDREARALEELARLKQAAGKSDEDQDSDGSETR